MFSRIMLAEHKATQKQHGVRILFISDMLLLLLCIAGLLAPLRSQSTLESLPAIYGEDGAVVVEGLPPTTTDPRAGLGAQLATDLASTLSPML
jgi:hypothetical protein